MLMLFESWDWDANICAAFCFMQSLVNASGIHFNTTNPNGFIQYLWMSQALPVGVVL